MRRITILFLLLAVCMTGCSYKITSGSRQTYRGESENWEAEYIVKFSTSFPEKDGKAYVKKMTRDDLTVTSKKDPADIPAAMHVEIEYNHVDGGSSKTTHDYDSPQKENQFHSGGGGGGTEELGDYLRAPENLSETIKIFSGPSYEMRANAVINATIRIDGSEETIILKPVQNTEPLADFLAQMDDMLKRMQFEKRYPGFEAYPWEDELDI